MPIQFFNDARNSQILILSIFLGVGLTLRDWTLHPDLIAAALGSCCLTQWGIQILRTPFKGEVNPTGFRRALTPEALGSLRSALITGLSLCLLLRTNHPLTMILAGCLAIASKSAFQIRGKHWFNPANFGIIAALMITHDAWVSPGQWGTEGWLILLLISLAGLVLNQVGRWDTSIVFLGVLASLEAVRNVWLGWPWDTYTHHFMSGSLLLFAFFMISDPRSIPNTQIARVIWASSIALVTFVLQHQFHLATAMFWALFVMAPLTIGLDQMWPGRRFVWTRLTLNQPAVTERISI